MLLFENDSPLVELKCSIVVESENQPAPTLLVNVGPQKIPGDDSPLAYSKQPLVCFFLID